MQNSEHPADRSWQEPDVVPAAVSVQLTLEALTAMVVQLALCAEELERFLSQAVNHLHDEIEL